MGGNSIFPIVPGHEIVGRVTAVWLHVKKFKVGDLARCRMPGGFLPYLSAVCRRWWAICEGGMVGTYNSLDKQGTAYLWRIRRNIVVDENYTLRIPENLDLRGVAPLLCAGITWFPSSALLESRLKDLQRQAVIGLGGLGHMASQTGCHDGSRSNGDQYVRITRLMRGEAAPQVLWTAGMKEAGGRKGQIWFHHQYRFLRLTVMICICRSCILTARWCWWVHLRRLRPFQGFSLILGRKSLAGSLIGGIRETQEMLDFCGQHNIVSDVEIIRMDQVNEAYERVWSRM